MNTLSHKIRNTLKYFKKKIYLFYFQQQQQPKKKKKAQKNKFELKSGKKNFCNRGKPTASPSAQQITNKPHRPQILTKKKKKKTNPHILTKGFIKKK